MMPKPSAVGQDRLRHLPGEPGLWMLIGGDLLMFGLFFFTFVYYRALDPATFDAAQRTLDGTLGLANTLILLTSSWLVALAARTLRGSSPGQAAPLVAGAMMFGFAFLEIKAIEYHQKLTQGVTLLTNDFFMLYFIYTGIHALHVVIGLGVLGFLISVSRRPNLTVAAIRTFEGGAAFWHLIDLLWVVLFALLYLLR